MDQDAVDMVDSAGMTCSDESAVTTVSRRTETGEYVDVMKWIGRCPRCGREVFRNVEDHSTVFTCDCWEKQPSWWLIVAGAVIGIVYMILRMVL